MRMLLLVLSLLVLSSCAVPEESALLPQEAVLEVSEPKLPDLPSPEIPPAPVKVAVIDELKELVEEPEFVYPFIGEEGAPAVIVEYGDFSNLVNSQMTISLVASIKRDYVAGGKAKFVFKPFPLGGTDEARMASVASLCMWEQGSLQFWAYHNTLFAYFSHLDEASLKNYATRVPNADKTAFVDCLDSMKYAGRVDAILAEGKERGFSKVPAFVIGDSVFEGDVSYKKLKSSIDSELASGGGNLITGNAVFSSGFFHEAGEKLVDFIQSFFRKI